MEYKIFIIIFVASTPYIGSLNGDFVFDDTEAIVKNKDVTSPSWIDTFYNDFWGTKIDSHLSHKSYRPFTIWTFKLNYLFNGRKLSAFQFKLVNLVSHILCCIFMFKLFTKTLARLKIHSETDLAYLAVLLFAVHPIHVEAISGVVGRADILAAITFFMSFWAYEKATNGSKYFLTLTGLLAGIAMLFKEYGVTVLGFCLVYEIVCNLKYKGRTMKSIPHVNHIIMRLIFLLLTTTVLLSIRWSLMGKNKPDFKETDNPAAFADDIFTKITSYSYIYYLNILLLVWPQWLCYDWSMGCIPLVQEITDYRIIFPILLYAYGFKIFLTIIDRRIYNRLIILALALIIIPFLPASNILYPVGFVIAERILYIPSMGYCLLVSAGFHKIVLWAKSKRLKKTEYKLFISGLKVCPLNAKVHYNVAKVADATNNTEWALSEYKEAIRLYPRYYQAMNNLANLLKDRKQFRDAELYLRKAVSHKEDFPAAWMNLGIVLANTKQYVESEQAYNNAIKYRNHYPDCYYNLGNLYLEVNKSDMAMASWYRAISLDPVHNSAWTNLLALLDNTGRTDEALQLIPKALQELPDSPSVMFAIANIYGKIDLYEEAEKYFLRTIKMFGVRVKAIHFANLGVLYHRWKKYDLANQMYEEALNIDPNFKSAYRNIQSLKKIRSKNKL